jgi:type II secretory pathway pseudopilin PulG
MGSSRGFSYLTVLFIVAILAGGLGLVGAVWHTDAIRGKEAELLFVGNQYRQAIGRYYLTGQRQYPRALSDLLKDPRRPTPERYLRRLYSDPVTGKDEWGLVKAPGGGILGVYSLSEEKPLKTDNFRARDKDFASAAKYSDWKFVFTPALQTAPKSAPGSVPKPPASTLSR